MLCAAMALVAPASSVGEEVEHELDALIEATNALDGFHAVYRMRSLEDETKQVELNLVYEAPDRARLDVIGPGEQQTVWLEAGAMHMRAWKDGTMLSFVEVDLTQGDDVRELEQLLYEEFPSMQPEEGELDPGPTFRFWWRFDTEGDQADLKFDVAYTQPRRQLLGWLDWLQQEDADVQLEPDQLRVRVEERFEATLSRETGFFTHMRLVREGEVVEIDLVGLDTDSIPELVGPPEPEPGAQDAGGELRAMAPSLVNLRSAILTRIERRVREDELDWSESRAGFEVVMLELQRRVTEPGLARLRTGLDQKLAEVRQRIEQELEQGVDPHEIRTRSVAYREQFELQLDRVEAQSVEQVQGSFPLKDSSAVADEMLEIELQVARELIEEGLRAPVLESFDEVVDSLLGE